MEAYQRLIRQVRVLQVLLAVLLGVIAGQTAGILAVLDGAMIAEAFVAGGVAFGGTVTLTIVVRNALAP